MSSSRNDDLSHSSALANPIPAGRKVVRSELQGILPSLARQQASHLNAFELPQPMEHASYTISQVSANPISAGDTRSDDVSELNLPPKMTKIEDVYIVSAVRTPIASFRGSFRTLTSVDLGVIVAKEAIKRAGIKAENVEETITGSVLTGNCGQNISRQIAIKSGIPESSNAFTVNKVCSSSLKALILATQSQQLGVRKISLIVGTESMSQTPFYLERGDHGYGEIKLIDGIQKDGISDAILNDAMGLCAEKTAKDYGITRQEQDFYALESYRRASSAWKNNEFINEIVPVIIKNRDGTNNVINEDEEYKRLVESKVSSLKPAFLKDGTGTITAANASSLNDGASAAIVICGSIISEYEPLAKIIGYSESGCAPVDFTIAPIFAVKELLERFELTIDDISRFEINEAFSVTAIAFMKELGIERNKLNVKGSAVALGHPIGMSGIRIITTLIHQLSSKQYGIATICNGGGEATAILLQKI